jgi:hypothetical protein
MSATIQQLASQMMPPEEMLSQHAEAIRAHGRRTVDSVVAIGRHLTEAKKLCDHGKWGPWLKREFGWGETAALRFMHTYDLFASGKFGNLADFKIPVSAIYLLAQPSTPGAAQQEILDAIAGGEKLSLRQVQTVITGHYAPKPKAAPKAKPPPQKTHLTLAPSPTQTEIIDRIIDLFKQLDRHGQRSACAKLQNIFRGNA